MYQEATHVNSLVESRYKVMLPFKSKCTKKVIEEELCLMKKDIPMSNDLKKV
jgi:hypothetical protein